LEKVQLIIIFFLLIYPVHAQNSNDNFDIEDEYYDIGMTGGITIYGERPFDFAPGSTEANIISALNGTSSERRNLIENDLLRNAGFRHTGNVRFRNTDRREKALSILHGVGSLLSFGTIPQKPFLEVEYNRLPRGMFFPFHTVISSSELKNISPEVLLLMEIEYMLQIEFNNGILYSGNVNSFTEENVNNFERLVLKLPDFPEEINQLRTRYLNIALPRIRRSLEQRNNPSEYFLRAMENLGNR